MTVTIRFLSYLTTFLMIGLLAACGGGGGSAGTSPSSASPSVTFPPSLFTTAPGRLTVGVGSAQEFTIGGGTSPYTAVSNNAAVAIAGVKDTRLTLGGVVNGTAEITVRDAAGASVIVSMIVSSGPVRPLYITATSSVTIAPGLNSAQTYQVGGGAAPYTATSSNTSVASLVLTGENLKVTGLTAGSTNIVVMDSLGATVSVAVTVPTVSNLALFTTAPSSVTVAIGASPAYSVGGGTGPYTATSSTTSVATTTLTGNSLTVTGVSAGSASIVVRDSAGTSVTVAVTVPTPATLALFTTAPSSVTVAIGASPAYSVGGGTGPYTVSSNNASIVTTSLMGNSLTITGRTVGSAIVLVRDSAGASVLLNIVVGAAAIAVTPTGATGIINDVLIATITGGTPPFRASVGNILVASASVQNENELTITLLQVGQTIITVLDANNQSTAYSLTSNAATPGIRLSPNAVTVSEYGSEPILLTVYGAAAGAMNVFSSDTTRLTATLVNQTITVTTGTNLKRCVNGDTPVTITVVDSTRATGIAIVTIQENGGTCP